jgi:hypothetical protein
MLPWQFSLRALLIAVGLTAVWCVALVNASPVWVMTTRGISLVSLLFAMLALWYRHGQKRAFWAGYLHAGLFYALLVFYAVGGLGLQPICTDADIPSGRLAMLAYEWMPASSRQQFTQPNLWKAMMGADEDEVEYEMATFVQVRTRRLAVQMRQNEAYVDPAQFRYIFHSAFVILAGYCGGLVGIWLFRTQDQSKNPKGD